MKSWKAKWTPNEEKHITPASFRLAGSSLNCQGANLGAHREMTKPNICHKISDSEEKLSDSLFYLI